MTKPERLQLLKSPKYNNSKIRKVKRLELYSKRGLVCEKCNCSKNMQGVSFAEMNPYELAFNLVLHEIYMDKNGKKDLSDENLLLLCKSCNATEPTVLRPSQPIGKNSQTSDFTNTNKEPLNQSYTHMHNDPVEINLKPFKRNEDGMILLRNWLRTLSLPCEYEWCVVNGSAVAKVQKVTGRKWLELLTCDVEEFSKRSKVINSKTVWFVMTNEQASEFDGDRN